jgi:PAS domain S-box-containing protein
METQGVEQRLAAIVDSSDDAIISKDLNGVITSWNRGAHAIFGYTASEAIGKPVLMLIPEGRHNEEPAILARIRAGEKVDHYQTQRRRKDGSVIDISVTISPIRNSSGDIIGASKIARDVTIQKQLQAQLESLAIELREARDELEQRVDERTASLREAVIQMEEFSYTVSHDLRAPLRSIKMYAQVLLEEYAPSLHDHPEATKYLNRIADNSAALDRMIQDVLTFGRVAREGVVLEPVSLDDLVTDLIHHYPILEDGSVDLVVEHLGEVLGHAPSLSQMLSNLVLNAVKFVTPGTRPVVHISSERRAGSIRVWIEDNGIGVDRKFQHRLFGLFERLHPQMAFEGNGVGLAIVRKAALRMNGAVGIESDGVSGSRFWFELAEAPP